MFSLRYIAHLLLFSLFGASVSCTTTYDQTGRPVKSVDPGLATVGIVTAALIGYALANDSDDRDDHYDHGYNYHDRRNSRHRRGDYRHNQYNSGTTCANTHGRKSQVYH